MTLNRFLCATASGIALVAAAPGAWAQTAPPAAGADASSGDEIVVTGYRASLRQSIDAKRTLGVLADVLTAEDIGKFPDRNVAEALQRIPGIVINREFGEGERVSLRGTAPNLTRTTLNGHSIATADWFVLEQLAATRSFNYLTLPSEIVGKLEVYKSPEADVEEGGVGGTINVHTRNPLDLDPLTVVGSAQVVYSERRKSWDPQFSGLVSWKNADESFGILIGGVYEKRDIRRDGVEVLGYNDYNVSPTITTPGPPSVTSPNPAFNPALVGNKYPSLIGSALFNQERERYGGNIGIQIKPSDDIELNVTGLYSRFNADNFNQNFLAWGSNAVGGGGSITNATVRNGTIVSGTIASTPTGRGVVFDAIDRKAFSEVYAGDADLVWHVSDRGTFHVQGGYTEAHGNTESQPFYEGGAPATFNYDLTGRTPRVMFTNLNPTNPAALAFDFGSLHQITNSDSEYYGYADYEHQLDLGPINAIKVGVKYTDHNRVTRFLATTFGGFFLPLLGTGCGGPCTSSNFADGLTPSDFLDNIGGPGVLNQFWQVDRTRLEQIYNGLPANVRARILNPPENFSIKEKTYGGFAMAKFGGDNWRGNVGVRVVRTDQLSSGNLIGVPQGPGTVNDNAFGVYLPVTSKRSYTDVLPSLNISFDLTPALVLRAAAGRTVARPDYTDIVPRISLNPGSLTASGGNPNVDPYRANQFDLSLEWYPDRDTIVAGAFFYKDFQSYIADVTTREVFPVQTATPNLLRCTLVNLVNNLYNCAFDVTRRANGPGGTTKGFEFQVQRAIWGGFGVNANYTYSDAKIADGSPVRYNSKHSLNVTGYFENELLSARLSYNYRSKFFQAVDRAEPLSQKATGSLDAALSVNITKNIAVTADAINLTNEKIEQFTVTTDRPRAIYDNGRQFYFGARFKF